MNMKIKYDPKVQYANKWKNNAMPLELLKIALFTAKK